MHDFIEDALIEQPAIVRPSNVALSKKKRGGWNS
jgi:hypothetical protein